jgi:hypothetical protein
MLQYFKKKLNYFFCPSKVAHNRHQILFSVLSTSPKPAEISFSVPQKCLLYNDFGADTYIHSINEKVLFDRNHNRTDIVSDIITHLPS